MRFSLCFSVAVATLALAPTAGAFCRTTTCAPPATFVPTAAACEPAGLDTCVIGGATVRNIPLWWHSSCAGYSMQKSASKGVTLADATDAAARAFAAWSSADCSGAAPTISARDLGPVACGDAIFDQDTANQNVIVFHDTAWPHKPEGSTAPSPTIALTTVSFNRDTGEILDADIEINTADHTIILTDSPGANVYDLESVLTHEAGHFLGIAHSPDRAAVMYFADEGGSARHRALTGDDAAAICAVYPPSGLRPVDPAVAASGTTAASACDPTPRGGLGDTCNAPAVTTTKSGGCSAGRGAGSRAPWLLTLAALCAVGLRRTIRARRSETEP